MGDSTEPATERHIEYLPVDEVQETPGNPKNHDLPTVILAICRLGYTSPVLLDERTGHLIAGNGRTLAVRMLATYRTSGPKAVAELGLGKVPPHVWKTVTELLKDRTAPDGIKVDDAGRWLLPVVRGWASTDDAQARAAVIADNKLSEAGGWYEKELTDWLKDIHAAGDDLLGVTGFDTDALKDIDAILDPPKDRPVRLPSPPPTPAPDVDDEGDQEEGPAPGSDEDFGDPSDDAAFMPTIAMTVDCALFDRWRTLLGRYPGRDDVEKFTELVADAEQNL